MSLKSLLTLASGAASLGLIEQSAQAAIWYTAFNATVGFGGGSQYATYSWNLPSAAPGDAKITMRQSSNDSHAIVAAIVNGVFGRQADNRSAVGYPGTNVAFRTDAGKNWMDAGEGMPPNRSGSASVGKIIRSAVHRSTFTTGSGAGSTHTSTIASGPGEFSSKYLLFKFTNSTHGDRTEYGWVGMSGATIAVGDPTQMSVTFTGWAYDDSGAVIGAGITAVPEASTGVVSALLAAMVVGGAELRRWRKSKSASVRQPA
jgi:hypothetical protein